MSTIITDIAVIGASLGGVMAAYSACKQGYNVILTEETNWIGGQLTAQAVPPDEHKWIEHTGCTQTYRKFRNDIRDYYRTHPYIIDELKDKDYFCPGGSSVSRLAHEPKIALKLLNDMLQPFVESKRLTIMLNFKLKSVDADSYSIKSVNLSGTHGSKTIKAKLFLDGTDIGDLIKLSGESYVAGAESKAQTGEIHAAKKQDCEDMQPVTYVACVDYDPKADLTIAKPQEYNYFRDMLMPYDKYPVLSMYGPDSSTGKAKEFGFFSGEKGKHGQSLFGLFTYRRIVASHHFKDNFQPKDITLLNWPQNDYFMGNIFDTDDDAYHIYMSKQLTLSFLYYLQTEAVRADGGKGYRGLGLRGDMVGTDDGLAKYPYIRESRRLNSKFKVTENMISKKTNSSLPVFYDSIGVGSYHIDLHITTKSYSFFFDEAHPFEIPLRALIAPNIKNLIPCCKNIGTTHLTNGCFRLHPVEWNIGESAGYLASYMLKNNLLPEEICKKPEMLKDFQDMLISNGIQLHWDKSLLY